MRKTKQATAAATKRPARPRQIRATTGGRWRAFAGALAANLRCGVQAAFFRRIEPRSVTASPEQLLVLVVLSVCVGLLLNRTFYTGAVVFNWGQVRALGFELPVFLLVGWLTARHTRLRNSLLLVTITLFAATLTMTATLTAILHPVMRLEGNGAYWIWFGLYWGAYAWLILIAAVLVYRTARLAARQVPLVVAPLIALSALAVVLPPQPMWYAQPPSRASSSGERDSPVTEEMLYLQPALAQRALAELRPSTPAVDDVYFVGFAPYAREDVFLKESEVIRALMDERFGTHGRSLLLVNNDKTLRRYPLATVTNLRDSLRRIGELIDKEEDVLVLYLTSHGSEEHQLSVSYWPLRLQGLDPAALRSLLDESGIKWRVIVVSACYSGGFVEPLRGPNTLVMTAADATRTSFGCGAESDFTYFAKALFDEQLRETYSFEQAFERALPVIRERESALQEEFSNPQIAMGEAMRTKLGGIERRLRGSMPPQ